LSELLKLFSRVNGEGRLVGGVAAAEPPLVVAGVRKIGWCGSRVVDRAFG